MAFPHGAMGLSGFVIVVFPDHTYLLFVKHKYLSSPFKSLNPPSFVSVKTFPSKR